MNCSERVAARGFVRAPRNGRKLDLKLIFPYRNQARNMRNTLRTSTCLGMWGFAMLGVLPSGCGSGIDSVAVRPVAPKDGLAMPRITEERMRACVTEYAKQLEAGDWAFRPRAGVYQVFILISGGMGGGASVAVWPKASRRSASKAHHRKQNSSLRALVSARSERSNQGVRSHIARAQITAIL